MADRVLIVSAEASSALYAQRLLEDWKRIGREVDAFGVGSREMEALGFTCLGRSEEMAVVGFKEVLRHYPKIRSVFHQLVEECRQKPPKFVLLLDYPDFNLRLAKQIHALGVPVVYYVSPQLWAWRKGRIKEIKSHIDKMLVLFPFEKDFYDEHAVKCDFVGHPILDELKSSDLAEEARLEHRQRLNIGPNETLMALMPGSRNSELSHHLELQIKVAEAIHSQRPAVKFALFVAPSLSMAEVREALPPTDLALALVQDEPLKMVNLADLVLTASGTATLVVGLLAKPMVVIYRMNSLSAWLAKRFVKGVKNFAMVNLVMGREVVPELFQEEANVENISKHFIHWIDQPEEAKKLSRELSELRHQLGEEGATRRVTEALEAYF